MADSDYTAGRLANEVERIGDRYLDAAVKHPETIDDPNMLPPVSRVVLSNLGAIDCIYKVLDQLEERLYKVLSPAQPTPESLSKATVRPSESPLADSLWEQQDQLIGIEHRIRHITDRITL